MSKQPLYEHQLTSVNVFKTRPIGLDASDPGTGKTRVQIELFASRRSRGGGCALIIAPKSLLRSAWEEDIRKFAPHLKTSVCPAAGRERRFAEHADVYITNTDAAVWLAKQKPEFFKKFDTLIIDEISYFKHRTSARSKAINKIKKHFKHRYGLTGTPNSNGITDLWHQVYILDDGLRLGKSFWKFRAEVCTPVQIGPMPNMLKWVDKPNIERVVGTLIGDITVRHKFEECLDIPDNYQYSVPYHLPPAQQIYYKAMEKQALIEIGKETVTAVNAAGVVGKLLQIASGAAYKEGGGYALVNNGRYELVADLVEQRAHSVVFFNWTHQRDELVREFEKRGLTFVVVDGNVSDADRARAVADFQAGFYRVFLAHPQSAAHGLTLVKGTATIWASPTYNLEHFLQGNRRIYRAGQTEKTETIVVIAPGTLEEKVLEKLNQKDAKQSGLLEVLKEMM